MDTVVRDRSLTRTNGDKRMPSPNSCSLSIPETSQSNHREQNSESTNETSRANELSDLPALWSKDEHIQKRPSINPFVHGETNRKINSDDSFIEPKQTKTHS